MDTSPTYNKSELDVLSNKLHNKYIGIEPMLLIGAIALLIIYYYMFSSLGNNEDRNASVTKIFFETALWMLFIVLLLLNGVSYIFGIDIIKTIKHLLGYETHSVADLNLGDDDDRFELVLKNQVFNLPEQTYSYNDAKAVCNAYDSRLASYDEMNAALDKGADWCSYGWSEGQMALFPTQQEKWDTLQKLAGHEKDCGHPGVNGGYIDDANLKFGVNCFGNKPSVTPDQSSAMRQKPIYKKNADELKFDEQVNYWRNNLSQIQIAPFNHNNWSML